MKRIHRLNDVRQYRYAWLDIKTGETGIETVSMDRPTFLELLAQWNAMKRTRHTVKYWEVTK